MNEFQFLALVRGPGLQVALAICLMGMVWRILEIYTLGRATNLAERRTVAGASGWHTLYRRFAAPPGMLRLAPITYIGGYVFHLGFIAIFFLYAPHILLIREITGLSWSPLPSALVDFITVITLIAMLVVLVDRVANPSRDFCPVQETTSRGQ